LKYYRFDQKSNMRLVGLLVFINFDRCINIISALDGNIIFVSDLEPVLDFEVILATKCILL